MADVIIVGPVGDVDLLRLGPSDDIRDEKIHDLTCLSLYLRHIAKWIHVY